MTMTLEEIDAIMHIKDAIKEHRARNTLENL